MLKALEQEAEQQDHYAAHLGEVDSDNPVISTEDIVNDRNIPIVKKGSRITKEVAERILQHKLVKPLEHQIQLQQSINGETLLQDILQLLEKYPELKSIHDASQYKASAEQLIRTYVLPPLLIQKLTVFQHSLPEEFDKTLFCTWLATHIAFCAKLDKKDIITTYLAGITHDLGMLHISPHILTKDEQLSAEEWRALQSHVVTSHLILKNIGGDCHDAARAVLEHHERCDGTGYPLEKTKEKLHPCGQIIAIADSLQAVRVNQLAPMGKNLYDTIPFLQMNSANYAEVAYKAAIGLIKSIKIAAQPTIRFNSYRELSNHLLTRGENLDSAAVILQMLLYLSEGLSLGKAGNTMVRVLSPVTRMIRSSGIIEDHIFAWLRQLDDDCDEHCKKDLCEMELMQNELYFQLKKARNSYITFLEQEPNAGDADMMQHLAKVAAKIDEYLESKD
jgi:HD-GYP domain-containing protein (c-di-GMP phosphodiesterase class II)